MKRFLIIFLFLLSSGCELVVDVDVPFDGEQLVVSSFNYPDSLWNASITLNRYILGPDSIPYKRLENATVTIHDESGLVATLEHVADGKYRSGSEKPQPGKEYTIHVSAPGHPSVEAHSMIPIAATIASVEIEDGAVDGKPTEIIKLTFVDRSDTKDFYHIRFEPIENDYDFLTGEFSLTVYPHQISSVNPDLNSQFIPVDAGLLVKDVLFNGKQTEVRMRLTNTSPYEPNYFPSHFPGFRVVLRSVSEDYYNYMATKQLQDETSGNPFAQPVNVYNNISNGFGIFAGLNSSIFEHNHPIPVITEISPSSGKAGDTITITGQNFESEFDYFKTGVNFRQPNSGTHIFPLSARVIEVTDTQLRVVVPDRAITGKLWVSSNGRYAQSAIEFQVTN